MNKRGQGLSTNAIILIILGIVVLVLLILGFTLGWNQLIPWLKTNNVATIVNACEAACSIGSTYDYCTMERTLKDAEGNEIKASCFILSENYQVKYGVKACSSTSCPKIEDDLTSAKAACTEIGQIVWYKDVLKSPPTQKHTCVNGDGNIPPQ